jgi:hypothetical protein
MVMAVRLLRMERKEADRKEECGDEGALQRLLLARAKR